MNRKMNWGIAALIIILIAAGGFMYWQWSDMQQFKEQLAQDEKQPEEKDKQVAENELPPAAPGKKWVPHGDHYHQVPIDAPDVWQGEPHQAPVQPVKVESVIIDGVDDLKAYLDFFESFGDDPSLEEFHKLNYHEKAIEYGISMRGFDYENASQLEKDMDKQINEKITALTSIWAAKFDVEWQKLRTEPELPEDFRTTIAMPDENEGGDE